MMGRPVKDKGKQQMDERATRKERKKRKREAMSPEELDQHNLKRDAKKSRK